MVNELGNTILLKNLRLEIKKVTGIELESSCLNHMRWIIILISHLFMSQIFLTNRRHILRRNSTFARKKF